LDRDSLKKTVGLRFFGSNSTLILVLKKKLSFFYGKERLSYRYVNGEKKREF